MAKSAKKKPKNAVSAEESKRLIADMKLQIQNGINPFAALWKKDEKAK